MGIIAHILESLPWKESEGIPAGAPKSLRLSGPGPEAAGQFGQVWQGPRLWDRGCRCSDRPRFHCLKQTSPRRSVMFLTAPQPPADPGLFCSPSTGFLIRHKHSWSQSHSLSRRASSGAASGRGGRRTGRGAAWPGTRSWSPLSWWQGQPLSVTWDGPSGSQETEAKGQHVFAGSDGHPRDRGSCPRPLPVTSCVTFGPHFPHL